MIIRYAYTLFIGILLALFIGVGISAFYPSPKPPEFPPRLMAPAYPPTDASMSAQYNKDQADFTSKQQAYSQEYQTYNKYVSAAATILAVLILVITLSSLKKIPIISDGFMLGSVFTLIYAIFRGFSAGDEKFRFLVVAISLTTALILGYIKIIRADKGK